eukprot:4147430-Heterocapsa_arctica.AAC.1
MSLRELMKLRLVELDGQDGVLTTLPCYDNLCNGRCTYCMKRDPRDICPVWATCRTCSGPLVRAQDELVPYDK